MSPKRYTPEQIISMLREAEVALAQGQSVGQACRTLGVSEQSYYRWRKEYGGLRTDQAKRLKDLEKENGRLRNGARRRTPPSPPCSVAAQLQSPTASTGSASCGTQPTHPPAHRAAESCSSPDRSRYVNLFHGRPLPRLALTTPPTWHIAMPSGGASTPSVTNGYLGGHEYHNLTPHLLLRLCVDVVLTV